MNSQNRRFREEIVRAFDTLHDAPEVRAVVLTGEGRAFSAGADLKERPGLSEEPGPTRATTAWSVPPSIASWNVRSPSSRRSRPAAHR
ncbi:MAG: Enoyl-CoA hydratase [uncultured Acetobacteraceae bacterium]|uniref:Enoyl-CoA hydratase n=1 Tax=uncultured Acetobacteraceae bacterium TaxID=169975 RepID=A0A6J4HWF7_9PROT|nr:MAG: Enoyl-CoA hydratase [uncultured Acetobacteraceae bacterium]